jgi:hypothetical protein
MSGVAPGARMCRAGREGGLRDAWADARFATDIMSEHGLFFALLMPPEVANNERQEALKFAEGFANLHARIAAAPPPIPHWSDLVDHLLRQGAVRDSQVDGSGRRY